MAKATPMEIIIEVTNLGKLKFSLGVKFVNLERE